MLLALLVGLAGMTWGLFEAKRQEGIAIAAKGQETLARQREANRADAEAKERKRADAEKQRAIRFRDQALDALRATTGPDVEKLLASKTELSANEREYLEAIANRWQGFAKQAGDDVETREYQVEGHFRVAFLWRQLGRRDEAQAEFQAALDLQRKLIDQFPDKPIYRHDLATTYNNMGNLLKDRGQGEEARISYVAAYDLLTKLVKQFPADPEYRFRLAGTRFNLGNLLVDLGDREAARAEFQSVMEMQRKLVAEHPTAANFQQALANTFNNLGGLARDRGEDSTEDYLAARNLFKKLAEACPDKLEYQRDLAGIYNSLGTQFLDLEKLEEAREQYAFSDRHRIETGRAVPDDRGLSREPGDLPIQFWDFIETFRKSRGSPPAVTSSPRFTPEARCALPFRAALS